MSLLDQITGADAPDLAPLAEAVGRELELRETLEQERAGADQMIEHLQESLADVELMLEDRGWRRLGAWSEQQFTRAGLTQSALLCRTMCVVNPLIRRGVGLRTAYVWGGGVQIAARATGEEGDEQDVNTVVQAFLDDKATRKALTSGQARETNERTLATDGNLFAALFTHPRTGRVQPRLIPLEEITDVIKNPEDRTEPWFYKRVSSDARGQVQTTYHPDVDFAPAARVTRFNTSTDGFGAQIGAMTIDPGQVLWDAPILHLKVNALDNWDFGIGDAFSAIVWARAYKEFLEDWAKLMKSLSRFAWRLTASKRGTAQNAAAAVGNVPAQGRPGLSVPSEAGATASMVGANLEAIPKTGATLDANSGRPLAAMVAAGLEVPVTMLLADPGVTGARATAETLDTPTELMAGLRRETWTDFHRRLLEYVIDSAVKAPQGALSGTVSRDEWGRVATVLDGDTERTVELDWPDLTETPINVIMAALEAADGMALLPPLTMLKLVLQALRVKDADEIVAEMTGEDGVFIPPDVSAGQVAVGRFNAGTDPAAGMS